MKATEWIPWLLLNQTTNLDAPGVENFELEIDFDKEWLFQFDKDTHSSWQNRLTYITRLYKPHYLTKTHFTFPHGCLEYYQDGHIKWRKRSEWFPKLFSDLCLIYNLTRQKHFTVTIPSFRMKPQICPVVRLWAQKHGYPISRWIDYNATKMIIKHPTPTSALKNSRFACRFWLLRYHVLAGNCTPEWYDKYRRHQFACHSE